MEFEVLIDDVFTTVANEHIDGPIGNKSVLSLINDFEGGEWRAKKFHNFIWDNIKETALSIQERNCLVGKESSLLDAAAQNLRLTDKEGDIGKGSELAEIVLYGIMKHHYKALSVVPKIFYKQNAQDNAKGADSVHIVVDEAGNFTLWFGEAKFYTCIEDARLSSIVASVKNSLHPEKLRKENAIITNVSDFEYLEIDNVIKNRIKKSLDQSTSLDELKPKINIPILLLHECEITQKAKELTEEYKQKIVGYGLDTIISTSSIIEGVNTSAENIVIWSNKKGGRGNPKLDDFTYKNIIGRGGRMFRHFVGKIYILEEPPATTSTQLELTLPDQLLGSIDEVKYSQDLTPEQIAKIAAYREDMRGLLHGDDAVELLNGGALQSSDSNLIRDIASSIKSNAKDWNGLGYLNSENPEDWDRLLYKIIRLRSDIWGTDYFKIVAFTKVISNNWKNTIPEMLEELNEYDIGLDEFFKLERTITYTLATLLNDVNLIYRKITKTDVDISPFAARVSYAFLPPNVFKLEEYGLPRMISRKICYAGLIDLANEGLSLHECIDQFLASGAQFIKLSIQNLDRFDRYVIDHFFEGIHSNR